MRSLLRELAPPLRLDTGRQRPMVKGVGLSLLGVVAQGGVRFATNLLIGRLGGPGALGLTSSAIALAQVTALLGPTTAGAAASKFVARSEGRGDVAGAVGIAHHVTRITVVAAVVGGLAAATLWQGDGHSPWWQRAVVLALVLGYSGYALARGIQFGAGRMARGTLWDLVTAGVGVAGVAVVMVSDLHPMLALVPVALSLVLYSVSGWVRGVGRAPEREVSQEIRTFVLLGIVGTLTSAGLLQGSVLVARAVGGLDGAGEYSSAMALATPASLVGSSVSLALFPSLSAAYGRGDAAAYHRLTDASFRALAAAVPVLFVPLVVAAPTIQSLVWGDEFGGETLVLPLLLLACMANVLGVTATNHLTSRGSDGMRTSTTIGLAGAAACIACWVALAGPVGITGVALGYLVAASLIWLLPVLKVSRSAGFRWFPPTLAVVAISSVALAASVVTANRGALVQLGTAVLATAVWVAVVRAPLATVVGHLRSRGAS